MREDCECGSGNGLASRGIEERFLDFADRVLRRERRRKEQPVGFARNDKFCRGLWDINLVVITFKP